MEFVSGWYKAPGIAIKLEFGRIRLDLVKIPV